MTQAIRYRPEIDGLRAIAVTSVIFYHAEFVVGGRTLFEGGYIGVDIFFVISGYLISKIIFLEYETQQGFSFARFYERRARRILPALLLVMCPTGYGPLSTFSSRGLAKRPIGIVVSRRNDRQKKLKFPTH